MSTPNRIEELRKLGFVRTTEIVIMAPNAWYRSRQCLDAAFSASFWYRPNGDTLDIVVREYELRPNDGESIRALFRCDSLLQNVTPPEIGEMQIAGEVFVLITVKRDDAK